MASRNTVYFLFVLFMAFIALVLGEQAPLKPGHRSYIMMFRKDTPRDLFEAAKDKILAIGGRINRVYDSAFKGYAVTIPENAVSTFVEDPYVSYVEEDSAVYAN